jgi:hypothetical protein
MSFIAALLSKCHLIFIKNAMKIHDGSKEATESDVKLKLIKKS